MFVERLIAAATRGLEIAAHGRAVSPSELATIFAPACCF